MSFVSSFFCLLLFLAPSAKAQVDSIVPEKPPKMFYYGQFDPIIFGGRGVCPDGTKSGATIHVGRAAMYAALFAGKGDFDDKCLCKVMVPPDNGAPEIKAKLFPNPATSQTILKSDALYDKHNFTFQVYSIDGKTQVWSGHASADDFKAGIKFDVSAYAAGSYVITLVDAVTNQIMAFKLIKL